MSTPHLLPITEWVPPHDEPLVFDDDGAVIGWRYRLADGTEMMVPLVPLPS